MEKIMTKQELQEWFYEKLFNCYCAKHKSNPNIKFLVYDKQFIRDCKLSSLIGGNIVFPVKYTGDILFEYDLKTKIIYCNYFLIWSFFESNCKKTYQEIQDLIKEFLGKIDNYKEYTPSHGASQLLIDLGNIENYKGYTPVQKYIPKKL